MIGATLLTVTGGALAAESSGTYMTFVRSVGESALLDGNRARVMHYYQAGTSEQAGNPFAGRTSECIGRMIVSSAGKVVAGAGFCFMQDAAGNGGSWTWKVTEVGTDKCPTVCGTFNWAEGYGSVRNATATGAWRQTYASKDGGVGTYTVTYTP